MSRSLHSLVGCGVGLALCSLVAPSVLPACSPPPPWTKGCPTIRRCSIEGNGPDELVLGEELRIACRLEDAAERGLTVRSSQVVRELELNSNEANLTHRVDLGQGDVELEVDLPDDPADTRWHKLEIALEFDVGGSECAGTERDSFYDLVVVDPSR